MKKSQDKLDPSQKNIIFIFFSMLTSIFLGKSTLAAGCACGSTVPTCAPGQLNVCADSNCCNIYCRDKAVGPTNVEKKASCLDNSIPKTLNNITIRCDWYGS